MSKRATSNDVENRRERAAAELRARQQRERTRAGIVWGAIGLVLLAVVGAVAYGLRDIQEEAKITGLDAVKSYKVEAGHVTRTVNYPQSPPAGGPHNPVWLNCGIYDKTVPSENAVHSMEHGAVWVTYRAGLATAQVEKLKEAMPQSYAVLSPYEGLRAPVVVSAWGKQLVLDGPDDPRLAKFISAYSQSSEAPEPGASCSGGSDGTMPLDVGEQMP